MVTKTIPNLDLSALFNGVSFGSTMSDEAVDAYLEQFTQLAPASIKQLAKYRKSLPISLAISDYLLSDINPTMFAFLSAPQQRVFHRELAYIFCILFAQYCLDAAEDRKQNQSALRKKMSTCLRQLDALCGEQEKWSNPKHPFDEQLTREVRESKQHMKYEGARLGRFFAMNMVAFTEGKTVKLRDWVTALNNQRIRWVRGDGAIKTMIAVSLMGQPQSGERMDIARPMAGYMSWILYYMRFSIHVTLLLKHTFHPTKAECQIAMRDRFKTQWDQRKFVLLNDAIWATANMACFLWLTGRGMLGYLGDSLTSVLMLVDVCLVMWQFQEEITQHRRDMLRFQRDLDVLEQSIAEFGLKRTQHDLQQHLLTDELSALLKQRNTVLLVKRRCELDWSYKQYGLLSSLAYTMGLLSIFVIATCFLFPPAAVLPATALLLGVVGAALRFGLNMLSIMVRNSLDVAKSNASRQLDRELYLERLKQFVEEENKDHKKILYLELKQLSVDSVHQVDVIRMQKIKWIRSVVVEVLMPPLIIASLMFMPLGVGMAALSAGFVLAVVSELILNYLKPKNVGMLSFDDVAASAEYVQFDRNAASELEALTCMIPSSNRLSFFSKLRNVPTSLSDLAVPSCFDALKDSCWHNRNK